jgi:hypothetical protein
MPEADHFEEYSWHDNYVHGVSLQEGESGSGTLTLDIDHIVKWVCGTDGTWQFHIAPADLVFHEVTDLVLSLDYASPSFAMGPFAIHEIRREIFTYRNGATTFLWRIDLGVPKGGLSFKASGFDQTPRGPEVISGAQCLSAQERSV